MMKKLGWTKATEALSLGYTGMAISPSGKQSVMRVNFYVQCYSLFHIHFAVCINTFLICPENIKRITQSVNNNTSINKKVIGERNRKCKATTLKPSL